jgi:hypothetical protein
MNTRLVLLAATLTLPATAAAQSGSLSAFRSDRDFVRYLDTRVERPTPPPPPAPPVTCTALPPVTPEAPEGAPDPAPAVITGRVTNVLGCPEAAVLVRIESLNAAATTAADGSFRLVIPETRMAAAATAVQITASRAGLSPESRSIIVAPGARVTQDFRLAGEIILLEDLVVTGAGVSITNNQHAGVDEGAIVKRHGDYLVILRRGRLFTVNVGDGALRPVSTVNAFGPDISGDAWYDEMLVSGSNVVVIGYSYARGGTELGLFSIDRAGQLRYRETYHMRSGDYYSSRNYASRLVGTRLVIYAPVPVGSTGDLGAWMPAMRHWRQGGENDAFDRTLPSTRIYNPGQPLHWYDSPTLHTVTTCDLARPRLQCESSAVLGPGGRVFYVSPGAVYVWTGGGRRSGPGSMVYRLPLDGAAPAALRADGMPVDQFSFLESDDGHLNVLVRSEGGGEGMWRAERTRDGGVGLLRVPLDRFGDGRSAALPRHYRTLPSPADPDDDAFHNRFVGRHLLYGTGNGWWDPESGASTLYAVRWTDGRVARVALPHGVDRIEAMGPDAVVVGADTADLHFTGIRLDGTPRAEQRYVQRGAQQGELRSHGFFYRADGRDEGIIGLPVRGPGKPGYEHLFDESASVLFLRNEDAVFRPLGELDARPEGDVDDDCIASCVDWYGNARPIFMDGRILALLGYEIVEGAVRDGRIHEVQRARFTPSVTVAAKP